VLGQSHRSRDQQVSVFEQDNKLMPLCAFCLELSANGGNGLPSLLDGSADAVLMMLCEAVPEGWLLLVASGKLCD
jgi:hypothetical protein